MTAAVIRLNSAPVVPPCKDTILATLFDSFLAVANVLTCTKSGSVIGLQQQLNENTSTLGPAITTLSGVEPRHDAFLRIHNGVVPNPAPFDTGLPIARIYKIGLQYTLPGTLLVKTPLPTFATTIFRSHRTAIIRQRALSLNHSIHTG